MGRRVCMALLALAACAALSPRPAEACSCIGPVPACQATWQVGAIFIGYVTAIEPVERALPRDLSQPTPDIFDARRVRMNVIEVFRGSLPVTIDLYTGAGGGDCGYAFTPDRPYLVYASQAGDGRLRTGICSNTRPLEAATDDLDYLRGLSGLDSSLGIIQGTARLWPEVRDGQPAPPYAGARVIATSDGVRYEAVTGPDGSYELRVPVGAWDLRVEVPDDLLASTWRTVEVRDPRGCAQADIGIRSNGRMTGRIVTARGEPLMNQVVELHAFQHFTPLPGRPPRDPYLTVVSIATTDQDGAFAFQGIAAGTYFPGVRLGERDPVLGRRTPILYPGTTDPAAASGIALPSRGRVVVDDFVLPASVVLVRGIVRGFDGRARPDVPVQFLSMNAAGFWAGSFDTFVRSGPDGSFQFLSLAGTLHRVVAGAGVASSMDERTQVDTRSARQVELPVFDVTPDMPVIEILLPD